ncbi:hypothetical protein LTR62_001461 [Meristemomyces frigidus]|uniref:Uncharacterized protein n=1 Tax=Meristemomyces frigidus TaxID=1508187 RepID=A0AAN7TH91_9PEZI|nr:hypothetical protein LTR62_001461 [Meristemomyces frigidus]
MDPPAYTINPSAGNTTVPTPVSSKRTITDLRAIILGNAQVIKPRQREDEIQLIVAKQVGPQDSAEEIPLTQHYAFLVMRKFKEQEIQIILKGEPQSSIDEALEWLADRTESVVADILQRHGVHATSGCCRDCSRTLRPGAYAPTRGFTMGTMTPSRSAE